MRSLPASLGEVDRAENAADSVARIGGIIDELERAMRLAFGLLRELSAARQGGEKSTRLLRPEARYPVSHFSRSKINRLIEKGEVRAKTVSGGRFAACSTGRI